jgi:FkbM family methyltransferase
VINYLTKIKEKGVFFYLNNYIKQIYFQQKSKIIKSIFYKENSLKIVLNYDNGTVDQGIYLTGIFGENIIPLIEKKLDKTKTFVDIGANIGTFSLILSNYCKEVIAFEPLPKLYQQFQESIKLNNFTNITAHNSACGNEKTSLEITINETNLGGNTLLQHNNILAKTSKQIVQVDRLDDVLFGQKVDVIKIDVEGYEYFVLLGAEKIITQYKPIIFIEYSPQYYEELETGMSAKLYNLIKLYHYAIYSLDEKITYNSFEELPKEQCDLLLTSVYS